MWKVLSARGSLSSLLRVVFIIVLIFTATLWFLLDYLPASISSTSLFAGLNSPDELKSHLTGTNFIKEVIQSQQDHPLTHSKPRYQLSVRYETRPYPHVFPLHPREQARGAMAAKFRSLVPYKIRIFYEDGRGGTEQGHLSLGQETTTNTYEGHVFFFTDYRNKLKEIARFTMTKDTVLYLIEDEEHPPPRQLREQTDRELAFNLEYLQRTGLHWRHFVSPEGQPRPPPTLFMWPARAIGEVHSVTSSQGYWLCSGRSEECRSLEPVHLELEVVSLAPRAFVIENFLNDFEASEIIKLGKPILAHSSVGDADTGAFESDTRTSLNSWVPRGSSPITESLFRRAADLLQIDENLLTRQKNVEGKGNTENHSG